MSYSMVCDGSTIQVRHWGALTRAEVGKSREEAGRMAAAEGVRKILVDLREGKLAQTTMEIFDFGVSYGTVFPPETKIAVVHIPGETGPVDDAVFAENVARNAGTRIRLLATMEEARAWLDDA